MPRFGNKRLFALGRLKSGEKNKTEAAYEEVLKERLAKGEILWYKFEGYTFKLAEGCRYTPDFAVMMPDRELQFHEVKGGFIMDDAKAKWKVAAELYPHRFFLYIKEPKKRGGGWTVKEYGETDKPTDDIDTSNVAQPGRGKSKQNKVRKKATKNQNQDQ